MEYILLRSSDGRARNRNGWIFGPFAVSSSSSVGYADGYADDCGVVDVLAIDLFGRAEMTVSGTRVGRCAAPVRLFARGRLLACIVEVSGCLWDCKVQSDVVVGTMYLTARRPAMERRIEGEGAQFVIGYS